MTNQPSTHDDVAKAYLAQSFQIDQLIRNKMEQLTYVRELATMTSVGYSHAKVQTHTNRDVLADHVARIAGMEDEIGEKLDLLVSLQRDIAALIQRVPNLTVRSVLEQRYLCRKPWADIAQDMACTMRQAYLLHRKGLRVVGSILSRREQEENGRETMDTGG